MSNRRSDWRPELLRCPFFGGEAAYRIDKLGTYINAKQYDYCVAGQWDIQATCVDTNTCGINTQFYKNPEQAAAAWNRRAPVPQRESHGHE